MWLRSFSIFHDIDFDSYLQHRQEKTKPDKKNI